MKKITLILALGFMFSITSAFSQGFQITQNGVDYTNGDFNVWFDASTSLFAIANGGDVPAFVIKNNGTAAKDVKFSKDETGALAGTSSSFCWGIQCYPSTVNDSPDPISIAGGANAAVLTLDFHPNGMMGISTIKYKVYDANNPSDFVEFNVHYSAGVTGVNEINASKSQFNSVFPNPATNNVSVNYNVVQGQSNIEVRNILGQTLQSISLSAGSKNANFSVMDYPVGVYFLTLKVNGNAADTKKLIVK